MNFIQNIINTSEVPILTAFLLGLIVAIHPCTLAANIAAIGYMAKDIEDKKRILLNGLFFSIGKILIYSLLGIIVIAMLRGGIQIFDLSSWLSLWAEKLLSFLLIIIGFFFLFTQFHHKKSHHHNIKTSNKKRHSFINSFLLGTVLALSFCPESAIVYFAVLIPLSIKASLGYFLPSVFSIGTAIPAMIILWVMTLGINSLSFIYDNMEKVKKWMNLLLGILFILAGIACFFL